ncbi:PILS5 [Symbiodinium sp. CCMP2592]|nr:PILS5 [Symbiodinium sp. CCMP2592]
MTLFTEAILVSVYANSEALLICCAGAYAMHKQIVSPPDLKSFSKVLLEVFFPVFAFSNFRVYSVEMLGKWYMACVGSAIVMIIGALMGQLGAFILRLQPPYSKILILSTTFGNCGALPYVLLPPIVSNWKRVNANPEDALVEGFAVISLFATVWTMALFFIGRPYALSMKPQTAGTAESQAEAEGILRKLRAVDSVVWCALAGIAVGCVAPLRDFLSDRAEGPLRFVGSFASNFGPAGVPLSTMILGGSLYMGARAEIQRRRATKAKAPAADLEERPPEASEEAAEGSQLLRLSVGAAFIKLLLMPAISIPLLVLAMNVGALPEDQPMLFMVLVIQTGVPSAQTALALLVSAGLQKQAGQMSIVYLPMYIASVFTLAALIVVAVTLSDDFNISAS